MAIPKRCTYKFWVPEDQVDKVLREASSLLPLESHPRSGDMVSSVYFDSDDLATYHRMVQGGSSNPVELLRVRWYGEERVMPARRAGAGDGGHVMLELKAYAGAGADPNHPQSTKERVPMREGALARFLDLGEPLRSDEAVRLIREADQSLDAVLLQEKVTLLLKMRGIVERRKLRPCVGTRYKRIAFQSPADSTLRLTVDTDILLYNARRNMGRDGHRDATRKLSSALLEVKVSVGQFVPFFVTSLVERGAIIELPKFSKFMTGVATFHHQVEGTREWWKSTPVVPSFKNASGTSDAACGIVSKL